MSQHLIAAAIRLADVLSRENAALRALDLARAAALLAEKSEAAEALAAAQGTATPMPGEAAVGAVRRLRELANENRALLEHALAVQTRVIGIVARASRPAAGVPRYGATGRCAESACVAPIALSARA